jgi:hypothetical protein
VAPPPAKRAAPSFPVPSAPGPLITADEPPVPSLHARDDAGTQDSGYMLQSLVAADDSALAFQPAPGTPRQPKHLAIPLVVVLALIVLLFVTASQLANPNK